jgi:hypothetical protein
MKQVVHAALGIEVEALVEKYLGLPTALGRSTDAQFEHVHTDKDKEGCTRLDTKNSKLPGPGGPY